jgi:hypothetical protein
LLTFATGPIDAVSVLILGHVFVANIFRPAVGADVRRVSVASLMFRYAPSAGGMTNDGEDVRQA